MKRFFLSLVILALTAVMPTRVSAQNFHYGKVQHSYSYKDGFGIDHARTIDQSGQISVNGNTVQIDDEVYTADENGGFKNAKGKKVRIAYAYNEKNELGAIAVSHGNIITEYLLQDEPVAVVPAAKK